MMAGDIIFGNSEFTRAFEWKIPIIPSLPTHESQYQPIRSPRFPVSNSSWFLRMCWSPDCSCIELYLHLESTTDITKSVDFKVHVMTSKGVRFSECSFNRVFEEGAFWGFSPLVTALDLKDEENGLISSGKLRVMCRISTSHSRNLVTMSEKLIRFQSLSNDLSDMFANKETCDAVLRVKDKQFQVHRFILMARSSVFADIFSHDSPEKQSGIVLIPDCDADSFEDFLEFMYTGKLGKISVQKARELYVTAEKYDVKELKGFCVTSMMRDLAVDNVCDIITLADHYDDEELLTSSQIFFNENFTKIFSSTKWLNLKDTHTHLTSKMLEKMASTIKTKEEHCVTKTTSIKNTKQNKQKNNKNQNNNKINKKINYIKRLKMKKKNKKIYKNQNNNNINIKKENNS